MKQFSHILIALLCWCLVFPVAQAQSGTKQSSLAQAPNLFGPKADKPVKYSPQMIPVCYNFGCKVKEYISLTDGEWESVKVIFKPQTNSPEVERIRIARAIAKMEQLAGKYTPIYRDIGLNLGDNAVFPGQLDCIDESINTTTFLHVLERGGLFKHHKVIKRAYRRAIFDQHWTGQIEVLASGDRYVIDTWFYANGEMPVVQPTEDWLDISIFTSYTNNSADTRTSDKGPSVSQQEPENNQGVVN